MRPRVPVQARVPRSAAVLHSRRPAPGLRGRIVGILLVTTVATLAVAALAVLGPLQQDLRGNALSSLRKTLTAKKALAGFRSIDPALLFVLAAPPGSGFQYQQARAEAGELRTVKDDLARQLGVPTAGVTLVGYAYGKVTPIPRQVDNDQSLPDTYADALKVFETGKPQFGYSTINGTAYVRAALPVKTYDPGQPFVLAVRKPIEDIASAVAVVRTAFIYAALAGLALTLLLGIPLSARIVRRLRHLREAALELASAGPAGASMPVDRARDEVGDLARAFETMQRRLHHQEHARRAFVATASHELRTPLTSLEGMLELLEEDLRAEHPDLEDARDLLLRARAQSRRLGRLAADLLDLSRLDAEVELRSEPVELGELGRAVIAEFDLGASERQVTLLLDDAGGAVWARGDPGSVARILRILLENAIRVSPPGSVITVTARNGHRAELRVSDEGPGVPIDERELIFQRFQRGRETAGQAGFGLGLAIGRELAERMGGALVLEDTGSPGATFRLALPVAQAPRLDPLAVG